MIDFDVLFSEWLRSVLKGVDFMGECIDWS